MSKIQSNELSALNAKLNCLVLTYKKVLPGFQDWINQTTAISFDPVLVETMKVMGRCLNNLENISYLISGILKSGDDIESLEVMTFMVKDDELLGIINNYKGNISNMLYIHKEILQEQFYI